MNSMTNWIDVIRVHNLIDELQITQEIICQILTWLDFIYLRWIIGYAKGSLSDSNRV